MKNNIDYYQHFVNSDQHNKFKTLRVTFGWAGEGKFWALNNRIGLADNCMLDLGKKYNLASLACDLDFTLEEFEEFIRFLDEECNLIIRDKNCITTEIVSENLQTVMAKRMRNRTDYKQKIKDSLRNSQKSEKEIQTSENIQRKGKEKKRNKKKGNNTGAEAPVCPYQKIISKYHEHLPSLPEVRSVSNTLKARVKARWKEDTERQDLAWWSWYFQSISECDWLMGRTKDWTANFDWLVGPKNMTKVLNGSYTNKKHMKDQQSFEGFVNG